MSRKVGRSRRRPPSDLPPSNLPTLDPVAASRARRLYEIRRIRDFSFGPLAAAFRDPTWDILLELALLNAEGSPACVSSLGVAAGISPTTVVRSTDRLVSKGLLARWCDPSDRRRSFLHLTLTAIEPLAGFLEQLADLTPVAGKAE